MSNTIVHRQNKSISTSRKNSPAIWGDCPWDDIDDPDCKPRTKPTPKYVRTAEDYQELTEKFGLNRRQAAERLDMSVDAVNAALGYYNKRMASA